MRAAPCAQSSHFWCLQGFHGNTSDVKSAVSLTEVHPGVSDLWKCQVSKQQYKEDSKEALIRLHSSSQRCTVKKSKQADPSVVSGCIS